MPYSENPFRRRIIFINCNQSLAILFIDRFFCLDALAFHWNSKIMVHFILCRAQSIIFFRNLRVLHLLCNMFYSDSIDKSKKTTFNRWNYYFIKYLLLNVFYLMTETKKIDDSVFQLNHDIASSYHTHNLNNVQILFSYTHWKLHWIEWNSINHVHLQLSIHYLLNAHTISLIHY